MASRSSRLVSRRGVLEKGAAAVGGAAALLRGDPAAAARQGAPAILTGNQQGRRVRATGQFNMGAIAPKTFGFANARQAFQEAADRTVLVTAVTPAT